MEIRVSPSMTRPVIRTAWPRSTSPGDRGLPTASNPGLGQIAPDGVADDPELSLAYIWANST